MSRLLYSVTIDGVQRIADTVHGIPLDTLMRMVAAAWYDNVPSHINCTRDAAGMHLTPYSLTCTCGRLDILACADVIDLTQDSDDDETVAPVSQRRRPFWEQAMLEDPVMREHYERHDPVHHTPRDMRLPDTTLPPTASQALAIQQRRQH